MAVNLICNSHTLHFQSKQMSQAGFWGGAIGGFIVVLLVISMKFLGFSDLPMIEYAKLWPKMLFFGTTAGGLGGWLACKFASNINQAKGMLKKGRLCDSVIFVSGFIVLCFAHQLSVRDALIEPGFYEIADSLREFGGLLGKPNFETVAAGLLGGASFLILVKGLCKPRLKKKTALKIAVKATIVGATLWSLPYVLFRFLTGLGILEPDNRFPSDLTESAIFIIDFSHPEHAILFVTGCLIYVYSVISFVTHSETDRPIKRLSKTDQKTLDEIETTIKGNMSDMDFGPIQLAAQFGSEMRSLNRKIKKLTGKSTTLFIRELRLQQAASLIEVNSGNITEICFEVGFRNMSYFERSFKEHFKMTPRDYQKRCRELLESSSLSA